MIDRYIYFYNHERIQLKSGEAPIVTMPGLLFINAKQVLGEDVLCEG